MLIFNNRIQCIQLQRTVLARAGTRVELSLLKNENTCKVLWTLQYNTIYYNSAKYNILIIGPEFARSKLLDEHRKKQHKIRKVIRTAQNDYLVLRS